MRGRKGGLFSETTVFVCRIFLNRNLCFYLKNMFWTETVFRSEKFCAEETGSFGAEKKPEAKTQKAEKTSGDVWATHCLFCACWDSGSHRGAGQDYCILAGQFSKDIRLFHFSSRGRQKYEKDKKTVFLIHSSIISRTGPEKDLVSCLYFCVGWTEICCCVKFHYSCDTIAVIQSNFCDPVGWVRVKKRVKKSKSWVDDWEGIKD